MGRRAALSCAEDEQLAMGAAALLCRGGTTRDPWFPGESSTQTQR